jgi:hypothetical protein
LAASIGCSDTLPGRAVTLCIYSKTTDTGQR